MMPTDRLFAPVERIGHFKARRRRGAARLQPGPRLERVPVPPAGNRGRWKGYEAIYRASHKANAEGGKVVRA